MSAGDLRFFTKWGSYAAFPATGVPVLTPPSTLDPATPTSIIGSPSKWGPYCLRNEHTAGNAGFVDFDIPAITEGIVIEHEFLIAIENLADGQLNNMLTVKNQSNVICRNQLDQVAGALQLTQIVTPDGVTPLIFGTTILVPSLHRVTFYWDIANTAWQVWFDGVSKGSGAVSGAGLTWLLDNIQPGGITLDGNTGTHFAGPLIGYSGTFSASRWDTLLGGRRRAPIGRGRVRTKGEWRRQGSLYVR
jgi:hypothetical protein